MTHPVGTTAQSGQAPFARALFYPDMPVPDGLMAWNGSDPAARFAIYRNNVMVALVNGLRATFPVTAQLVGDAFFNAMAAEWARDNPPRSRLMAEYGAEFPDFIAEFAPAKPLAYLADVARLERLRVTAYHALDATPLAVENIAAALGGDSDQVMVTLHPSFAVLRSRYAIVSLWAAHQAADGLGQALDAIKIDTPEDALVLRPLDDVHVHSLAPGEAALITCLHLGQSLADALAEIAATTPDFNLTHALQLLLQSGIITGLRDPS